MKNLVFFITVFLVLGNYSAAVVKRHDVPQKDYEVSSPGYLIDMPHEGHGVLISSQWIVTVAHTIFYEYRGKTIKIGSKNYEIDKVIKHPSYLEPDKSLLTGDAAPLMNFLKGRSDIALIKLTSPVSRDVKPIEIYQGNSEVGKTITVYGRGATGNGIVGEDSESKALRIMNSFQNVVETSSGNWLSFNFDSPPKALALEGIHGSGDSGGASIIYKGGLPVLVGLSSWQYWKGDLSDFKGGLYGTTAYQVRLSSYKNWILSVMGS